MELLQRNLAMPIQIEHSYSLYQSALVSITRKPQPQLPITTTMYLLGLWTICSSAKFIWNFLSLWEPGSLLRVSSHNIGKLKKACRICPLSLIPLIIATPISVGWKNAFKPMVQCSEKESKYWLRKRESIALYNPEFLFQ